jgi:hypothetical protein
MSRKTIASITLLFLIAIGIGAADITNYISRDTSDWLAVAWLAAMVINTGVWIERERS